MTNETDKTGKPNETDKTGKPDKTSKTGETDKAGEAGMASKTTAARGTANESSEQIVGTPAGEARITWHRAKRPRLVLALGHGAGGGIEARDLRALAAGLPPTGVMVALVEQPWRVAGKRLGPAPKALDTAWRALWPALRDPGLPVVAGGRSAGARVACRTGRELGARAVLALSFPLHPPGRPEKSRAAELLETGLPTLVVQGGNDPFGKPAEYPDGAYEFVEVPHGDHSFALPKRAPVSQDDALEGIVTSVAAWLCGLGE